MKCAEEFLKLPADLKAYPGEHKRPLRVGGVRPASAEDAQLVDLARRLAPLHQSPPAQAASEYDQWGAAHVETATPHSAIAFVPGKPSGRARGDLETPQTSGFSVTWSHDCRHAGPAMGRRSGRWTRTALAVAPAGAALLFGAALFVAVFGPKGSSTGARSVITRPALVRVISSEERPTALHVDPSSAAPPSEPSLAGVAAPASVGLSPPASAPVTPVATLGPAVSQSVETNPVRTASPPPDATTAPSAAYPSDAAPLDVRQRPAEAAPMAGSKIVSGERPPPPNLDLHSKLPRKTPFRVAVAKTAATAPSARAEMLRQPQRPGASAISPAPAEPQTTAAPAAAQEAVNSMTRVFSARANVLGALAVDQTAAKSGNWAIQFGAPKSEAGAEATAVRLNAKYARALDGATIGVHKTEVNGETIYALRVTGLSKADAATLCLRVTGRDCSIAK